MPDSNPCSDPRCSAAHHDGDVDGWLAQEDARTEAVIERHGWMVQAVIGAGPRRPDDIEGRFPWDAGYAAPRWLQPLPATAAWRA